ncbi:MAG: hypothetical protein KKA16_00920 [Alphaproteobacteria bacterium]|nr:hypothetical protein [Alphaproteobacteria bacterium]MBU2378972.1 hypothetical protein [Alphaproteobacteria bacterium]
MWITAVLLGISLQPAPSVVAPTPGALDVDVPTLAGAVADPTCGGRQAMTAVATCVSTTQAAIEGVVDAWNAAFEAQGWLAADGSDNRIVYIRRREAGGCDAFQVLAFADNMASIAPAAPAYLALAPIPGDVCAAEPDAPAQ